MGMKAQYQGKRVEIALDDRGYFWVVWHNEKVPQSPAFSWKTEQGAMADARRFIDRTYTNRETRR